MPTVTETPENEIVVINEQSIKEKIYYIRGQQIMLDFDLAEIYGYTTKTFNQQVKRNIERFEEDFMFQFTQSEFENLRSQFVTSSWGGSRYLPYAFTEQGIYMLTAVLKGELAVNQSKALIRVFKKLKDYYISTSPLLEAKDVQTIALQTVRNSTDIAEIKAIIDNEMIKKADLPDIIRSFGFSQADGEFLILNGETVEASLAYMDIYRKAQSSVFIIDNYIGLKTLYLLKNISQNAKVTVFSDNIGFGLSLSEYNEFKNEFPNIPVVFKQTKGAFHDRYIILDYKLPTMKIYHCGASSKDAGKRVTTISEISEHSCYEPLIDKLLNNPVLKLK